jgi:YgiT-type zinc finger domain-containing protein
MEEGLQDQKTMICLICRKAQLDRGFTTVIFDRDEMKLVVNEVPALVCHNCGEAYLLASIASPLLQFAERSAESGRHRTTSNYNEISLKIK